jgi:DNA-directed RNA polymerase III subunit RPC1
VGQQSVGGSRIQEGFVDRTLPAYPEKAKDPPAKGFVANR